jgi:hypothetical protein
VPIPSLPPAGAAYLARPVQPFARFLLSSNSNPLRALLSHICRSTFEAERLAQVFGRSASTRPATARP